MICNWQGGGEVKGYFLFVSMGEIIPHLCDVGREALGKLTSNSKRMKRTSGPIFSSMQEIMLSIAKWRSSP